MLPHANTLVTNFILNTKLHTESRQTAALCLLLGIPEVWVLNGSRMPSTGPLRGVKPDASSFCFAVPLSPSSASGGSGVDGVDGVGGDGGGVNDGVSGGDGGVDVSGGVSGGGVSGSSEGATPLLLLPQQHGAAAFASASGWGSGRGDGGVGRDGGAGGGAAEDREREDQLRKQAEVKRCS